MLVDIGWSYKRWGVHDWQLRESYAIAHRAFQDEMESKRAAAAREPVAAAATALALHKSRFNDYEVPV